MLWVTRAHARVDRVACPWLIRRFVDPEARFLFVPKESVSEAAKREGAIPFDAPGVELGHVDGRCSFESILARYGLDDPALLRLARIVHAADIAADRWMDPVGPGLHAVASGFRLLFPDDAANLERQFVVYDALFAWCRAQVETGEVDQATGRSEA